MGKHIDYLVGEVGSENQIDVGVLGLVSMFVDCCDS